MNTYTDTIGRFTFEKINNLNNLRFFSKVKIIIKEILFSIKYSKYEIIKNNSKNDYNRIILSWGLDGSIDKRGNFKDKYLNISSKDVPNTLWFIIFLGKNKPERVNKNIILLKTKNKFSFNFFKILLFVIKDIKFLFRNFYYYLNLKSSHFYFSNIYKNEIQKFINKNVKNIFMPYEGQPFQNNTIRYIKEKNLKIKSIGYVHSPLLPLPLNFICKKYSPDKIFLTGEDQFFVFSKYLGWKKKDIKLIPSLRFNRIIKKNVKPTIFLPHSISDPKESMESIIYLNDKGFIDLKDYKIQNHPVGKNNSNNKKLINSIQNLKILVKRSKRTNGKKYLIFIGNSGAVVEFLERGYDVIHICEKKLYDLYSSNIWRSISNFKIKENIYIYKLKRKGKLIKLGKKKENLKNFNYILKQSNKS